MSANPSRLRDSVTTIGAALLVGAAAYGLMRLTGAPPWGCYGISLHTVLAVQVSKAIKRGVR